MKPTSVPAHVTRLVDTVRTTSAAASSGALRRAVADHAAALSLDRPDPAPIPKNLEPYTTSARPVSRGLSSAP